jgi:selenocysteine lyase/cysteine desulfurase
MSTPEWDLANTRDWVVQRCWEDHKRHPGGIGLLIQPEDLQPQDPPFESICEAVEYLQGKEWVTAEFGRVFGQKTPAFISKLRLTPQAIVTLQDQLEEKPRRAIGFRPEA